MNMKAKARSLIESITFTNRLRIIGEPKKHFIRCLRLNRVLRGAEKVFFLKVNNSEGWNIETIQNWLDIAHQMGAISIFVCDSRRVKDRIIHTCAFYSNDSFAFTKSKTRKLNMLGGVKNVSDTSWRQAASAHLTPFLIMEEMGIRFAWHIDGDDTRFCLSAQKTAEILRQVEQQVMERGDAICSLDMHNTMFNNKLWTFGVCFVDLEHMVPVSSITSEKNLGWWGNYSELKFACNLDTYFTYLRDKKALRLSTFFVKNVFFQHGVLHITRWLSRALYFWTADTLMVPVIPILFGDTVKCEFPVPKGSINIDIGLDVSHARDDFFRRFLPCSPAEFLAMGVNVKR